MLAPSLRLSPQLSPSAGRDSPAADDFQLDYDRRWALAQQVLESQASLGTAAATASDAVAFDEQTLASAAAALQRGGGDDSDGGGAAWEAELDELMLMEAIRLSLAEAAAAPPAGPGGGGGAVEAPPPPAEGAPVAGAVTAGPSSSPTPRYPNPPSSSAAAAAAAAEEADSEMAARLAEQARPPRQRGSERGSPRPPRTPPSRPSPSPLLATAACCLPAAFWSSSAIRSYASGGALDPVPARGRPGCATLAAAGAPRRCGGGRLGLWARGWRESSARSICAGGGGAAWRSGRRGKAGLAGR